MALTLSARGVRREILQVAKNRNGGAWRTTPVSDLLITDIKCLRSGDCGDAECYH